MSKINNNDEMKRNKQLRLKIKKIKIIKKIRIFVKKNNNNH